MVEQTPFFYLWTTKQNIIDINGRKAYHRSLENHQNIKDATKLRLSRSPNNSNLKIAFVANSLKWWPITIFAFFHNGP